MNQPASDPIIEHDVSTDECRRGDLGAVVYDTLHRMTKPYALEAAALTSLIRGRVSHAESLLDVGCGTGEHLQHFATSFEVQGLDESRAMLDVARPKLPGVKLHCADMHSFRLRSSFDAVTCLFSSIGYVQSTNALDAAFSNMAGHLADGGVLIVEPWHHRNVWPRDHTFSEVAVTETGFVQRALTVSVIDDVSVLKMKYTIDCDGQTSTFREEHRLGLFSVDDYVASMRSAGLAVEHEPVGLSGRGLFIGRREMAADRTLRPNV